MSYYLTASTLALFFVAIIWMNDSWINILFKLAFYVVAIVGFLLTLEHFGFLLKK